MKNLIALLLLTLTTTAFAQVSRPPGMSPFSPEADQRFTTLESNTVKVAKVIWDPSSKPAQGASTVGGVGLGVYLPARAIVQRSFFYTKTTVASVGGQGKLGFFCQTPDDIFAKQSIEGPPARVGPAAAGANLFGTAQNYAALGSTAVTGSAAAGTVLTGNLGIYPNGPASITNFPPSTVSGTTDAANAAAQTAQASALATYNALKSTLIGGTLVATVVPTALDATSPAPGVYRAASGTFTLDGVLTLNGTAADVWVFQTSTTLVTGGTGVPVITLTGGALARNVFWIIGSAATLNSAAPSAGSVFKGNVITGTAITETQAGTILGSLVAFSAVTYSAPTVSTAQPLSANAGAGTAGRLTDGKQLGDINSMLVIGANRCQVKAEVTVAPFTAGKIDLFLEYVVAE